MLIGGPFAPIFPIKIDTWRLAINENVDVFLKDFAFLRLYFRTAKLECVKKEDEREELL